MIASLHHCLALFHQQEDVRVLQLNEEKEKCRVLEESLNVLAKQHYQLEQSLGAHLSETDGMNEFLASNDNAGTNVFAENCVLCRRPRRSIHIAADVQIVISHKLSTRHFSLRR